MLPLLLSLAIAAPSPDLLSAVQRGDLPAVRRLLAAGASPSEVVRVDPPAPGLLRGLFNLATGQRPEPSFYTPIGEAVVRANASASALPVLDALLAAGADPNAQVMPSSPPPLVDAARANAVAVADRLLRAGASPDGAAGHVPLAALAARMRAPGPLPAATSAMLDRLLAAGARPDLALCAAVRQGDEALFARTAPLAKDVDAVCPDGHDTPLLAGVRSGRISLIRQLLGLGADIHHEAPPTGLPPLSLAATLPDHSELFGVLMAAGATRDELGADGRTALQRARAEQLAALIAVAPLDARETAALLLRWAEGAPDGAIPPALRETWTVPLAQAARDGFGPDLLDLGEQLGVSALVAAPGRLGVLTREERTRSLSCPLVHDRTAGTLTIQTAAVEARRADPLRRIETRGSHEATWLKRGGGLVLVEPTPVGCALLPGTLTGSLRAELRLALGPPDHAWADADAWLLRPADGLSDALWRVQYDARDRATSSALDLRAW